MDDELAYPRSDREFALCWEIFTSAAEHITTKELKDTMSTALKEQRERRDGAMREGWIPS
jgi:hypothetical protein